MKTLKLGALALGMLFAGSAMAMEEVTKLRLEISRLYDVLKPNEASLTDTQKDEINSVPDAVTELRKHAASDEAQCTALKGIKSLLENLAYDVKFKQAGKLGKSKLATVRFVTTYPKSIALVAAAAVIAAGYVVYKKFTAKKKAIKAEDIEDETEVEVTVK